MSTDPATCPASHAEIVAVLADAIRISAGGGMSRGGEAFMAGLVAEHLADRLALAGFIIMRPVATGEHARQRAFWGTP